MGWVQDLSPYHRFHRHVRHGTGLQVFSIEFGKLVQRLMASLAFSRSSTEFQPFRIPWNASWGQPGTRNSEMSQKNLKIPQYELQNTTEISIRIVQTCLNKLKFRKTEAHKKRVR